MTECDKVTKTSPLLETWVPTYDWLWLKEANDLAKHPLNCMVIWDASDNLFDLSPSPGLACFLVISAPIFPTTFPPI